MPQRNSHESHFFSTSFWKNLGILEFFKSVNSDFNCFNSVSETEVKLSVQTKEGTKQLVKIQFREIEE